MGGRRLSPGEGVDALEEAIDVIRALWDVDAAGAAEYEGSYYRLTAPPAAPRPSTTWASGWAPTSRGCST